MKSDMVCAHTCKGLCNAIELALKQEKEIILQYAYFRDECNYPDVKVMLNELILQRQKSIKLLEQTKLLLKEKFDVLDQVRAGFEM